MKILQIISLLTTLSSAGFFWVLEGLHPFFKPTVDRNTHAVSNFGMAACNLLILFPSMLLMASVLERTNVFWPGIKGSGIPAWMQTIAILTILDCWMYCWHRMNHEVTFFWRFHSIHHSDPIIDVTTAWRFHFMEILFSELLKLPVFILIGAGIEDILLYTILMTPVIAFHHSNVKIPDQIDKILRNVIPTPLLHRIHHSIIRKEHDTNYGSMLSLWDRIFRSFLLKNEIGSIKIGLSEESSINRQTISALLLKPFKT
ncbi:MAG: sterol desaturase family protein [Chlorobiaceae bacterium]|jgi:sterol desaturase/sphingolipid hydroxylase (fatty acid hydroxylase superfamily)|nr:sterol desaturase family protein [Chlorobiaceae bacterium]